MQWIARMKLRHRLHRADPPAEGGHAGHDPKITAIDRRTQELIVQSELNLRRLSTMRGTDYVDDAVANSMRKDKDGGRDDAD